MISVTSGTSSSGLRILVEALILMGNVSKCNPPNKFVAEMHPNSHDIGTADRLVC